MDERTRVVADRICKFMCAVCERTGHPLGCGLLNRRLLAGYDDDRDEFRVDLPNPLYPVIRWAVFASRKAVIADG